MEVDLVSDLHTFESLRTEWNQLAANFHSPLLSHEWLAACLEVLAPKHARPSIFIARSGGKLRAAAPFLSSRRTIALQMIGAPSTEPCGFIYDSETAAKSLLKALIDARQPFHVKRLGKEAIETQMLGAILTKGYARIEKRTNTLRVPLQRTWDEFEASISSGRRSDLRRYRRRAEKLGKVEFEAVHPDIGSLAPHMEELLRVEASGWKGQSGSALLCEPQFRNFYEHYARSAARSGMLRLFFLRIGGKIVAARLAVEYSGRLWDLKIGYDETLSKCAPGVLLTHETLRYAINRGLNAHEFLGQAEAWERHWPCEEEHYISVGAFPFTLKGQLSFVEECCRFGVARTMATAHNAFHRVKTKIDVARPPFRYDPVH
jgi:CelD/BcsL family acetyltransferase involved in cellulose biosynthesis